ncbi:MAG: PDDEXK nuclease domain-containing protein, partial [Chlamydiia bacterium]
MTQTPSDDYSSIFNSLKQDILESQLRVATEVSSQLLSLYWRIGKVLSTQVTKESWGSKPLKKLSSDLTSTFPGSSGFSERNLKFMRQFFENYPGGIWETAVSQLPWGHNILLIQKFDDPTEREWYAKQTAKHGWSRAVLSHQIQSGLFHRQGKAITNFERVLPSPGSDLAQQTLKDPYNFSFLAMEQDFREAELEQGLMNHVRKFLLELGEGFALLGQQYKVEIDGDAYYLDLLFYHVGLRCYIVVELKG